VHTIGRARPKVWRGERPTEPTPLVEWLRRTPYRDPNQLELTGSDDQAAPPSTWPSVWASCSCAAAPVPVTSSRA
jgi:hypothetical protein